MRGRRAGLPREGGRGARSRGPVGLCGVGRAGPAAGPGGRAQLPGALLPTATPRLTTLTGRELVSPDKCASLKLQALFAFHAD